MRPTQVAINKVANGFIVEVVDRTNKSVEAFIYSTIDEALAKVKEVL